MNRCMFARFGAVTGMLALLAGGCDSPVDPADHPAGVVFLHMDGSEAARYRYPSTVTGELTVAPGETATYRVRILTEEDDLIDFDGVEYSMQHPVVVNGVVADIAIENVDRVVITGLQPPVIPAYTTVRVQLHHGEHEEFEVKGVPLVLE